MGRMAHFLRWRRLVSPNSSTARRFTAAPQLVAFPVLPAVVERRSRGWLPPLPDGSVSQLPREFTSFCDAG